MARLPRRQSEQYSWTGNPTRAGLAPLAPPEESGVVPTFPLAEVGNREWSGQGAAMVRVPVTPEERPGSGRLSWAQLVHGAGVQGLQHHREWDQG